MSIIIKNDNEYKYSDGIGKKRDYSKLSKEETRNYVKESVCEEEKYYKVIGTLSKGFKLMFIFFIHNYK